MAPSIERFKTATLGRSYRCILPLLWTIFKNISVEFLLVEGYLQGALQKELRIAPFVERFKTAFLGMSYFCQHLEWIGLNTGFLLNFCW